MVSTRPLISKSSSPVPILWRPCRVRRLQLVSPSLSCSAIFFSSLARSQYLSHFSLSFSFILWSAGTTKTTIRQIVFFLSFFFFFFLLTVTRFSYLAEIRWSVCISNSPRTLCVSFSRTDSGLCIYHLFVRLSLNFSHNSQCITFPTQSCTVLYSLCANLLHLLIIFRLYCHIIYICYFVRLVYFCFPIVSPYDVFCAAIRRDSVSHLSFLFLCYVQVFLCEISLVCRLKYPYSSFSSHFCFLVTFLQLMLVLSVLFLVAVISLASRFF